MTSLNIAIELQADFHTKVFLPALERAGNQVDVKLLEALERAIALSKSPGPAGKIGDRMVNEVSLAILFESMPKARAKGKK